MKLTVRIERYPQGTPRAGLLSARVEQNGIKGVDLLRSTALSKIETARERVTEALRGHEVEIVVDDPESGEKKK